MMAEVHRFRILTPDGTLSRETFAIAPEQPETVKADCLLVVDETTGQRLTIHETRLFPAELHGAPVPRAVARSVCLECGRVSGVVEDEVACPNHQDGTPCELVQARPR